MHQLCHQHSISYLSQLSHYPPLFSYTTTATTEIYTLSLHDALPICGQDREAHPGRPGADARGLHEARLRAAPVVRLRPRSEEHTSELQSRFDLVCRLLLEKKKINM